MPHSVIVHEFFNRAQPRKALLLYADCMTMSDTHRIILSQRPNTIMVRRTQEAVLFVTEDKHKHDCMHSLSNPIFWTRAIRTGSHNASHRANRNLCHKAQYTHAKRFSEATPQNIFDAYQEEWAPIGRLFQHRPAQVGLFCTILFSTGL